MKAQRNTVQRQIVLDAVKNLNSHPTVEEVYARVHFEHPQVSKSTVYRNIRYLEESGYVSQIAMPDGPPRFDARTCPHYHFRCSSCERIFDVGLAHVEGINDLVQSMHGFEVGGHDIMFTGQCLACKKI